MSLTHFYGNDYQFRQYINKFRVLFSQNNNIVKFQKPKNVIPFTLGFKNCVNTCFINSIMHSLVNIESIVNDLLQYRFLYNVLLDTQQYKLFNCIIDILHKNFSTNINQEGIDNLIENFIIHFYNTFSDKFSNNNQNSIFIKYDQEDANKFLDTVLNMIDEVVGEIDLIVNYNDFNAKKNLFLNSQINIDLTTETTCFDNSHKSLIDESYRKLVLEIKDTLDKSLAHFFEETQLNDTNNLYFCSRCKKYTLATTKFSFKKQPNVLLIYLKRFAINVNIKKYILT